MSSPPYDALSTTQSVPALVGQNTAGGIGVSGSSTSGQGVAGQSQTWQGVYGSSNSQAGVVGESQGFDGVYGISHAAPNAGVSGHNDTGTGVWGFSTSGRGVAGQSQTWQGVYGSSNSQAGVVGESQGFDGVFGVSHSNQHAGVSGHNTAGGFAGFFDGNVTITGTLTANVDIVLGADCAEEFDVAATGETEPGTVMVLDQHGTLQPSQQAYDKKVAGVISGAGDYKPGLILDKKEPSENRMPVALVGKVYCKVDAQYAPIEVGDLLTTSPTPGHAMKADNPFKAFGAVIGKALRSLENGQGLIPILIALQ